MYENMSNDELRKILMNYTGRQGVAQTVVPTALLQEIEKRLEEHPDFRPMR